MRKNANPRLHVPCNRGVIFLRAAKTALPKQRRYDCGKRHQTARSTLLERRHLVQAYTWHGVPFTIAFTRLTLGFQARLERLWE